MATIDFENFSFTVIDNTVVVSFASYYEFSIPLKDLQSIDTNISFNKKSVQFPNTSERTAENKLNRLIDQGFSHLVRKGSKRRIIFIDESTEIPLVGSNEFGIVDRDTNILEIKPSTGCNLNCIYCSVNEGINNKVADILIDPFYLAQEAAKLAVLKTHPVEFNIGPHGEPLMYPFMLDLVRELNKIPNCQTISVNTNGTLLTKKFIDELKDAGLTRINLSLNTLNQELHSKLSHRPFNMQHILSMVEYCKKINMAILLAPVVIPGFNDDPKRDIEPLIKLAKTIKSPYPTIGFQNFLIYKGGRNPVKKSRPFDEFFNLLKPFEEKYDIILTPKQDYNPFAIFEDKTLEKPMKKNSVVKARIVCVGRSLSEKICVAHNRLITVRGLHKTSGSASIKIVRDKHNVFLGVPA